MGSGEPRVTFRLPKDVKAQLDSEDGLNTSGLMRSLVESYLLTGDAVEVGLTRRMKEKENELERKRLEQTRLESDIERIQREIDDLEAKIEERRTATPEEVIEFAERVKSGRFDRDNLDADNPAVMNWAGKTGIPAGQFIDMVEERL